MNPDRDLSCQSSIFLSLNITQKNTQNIQYNILGTGNICQKANEQFKPLYQILKSCDFISDISYKNISYTPPYSSPHEKLLNYLNTAGASDRKEYNGLITAEQLNDHVYNGILIK